MVDRYDGPSIFNKRQINRRKRKLNPYKTTADKEVKTEEKSPLKFNKRYESKKPVSNSPKKELKTEAQTYSNKSSQPQKKPKPRSGSNFRVSEVPSPMFGYNKKQKERLQRQSPRKSDTRHWNYLELKKCLSKEATELLITEEFKTSYLEKQWDTMMGKQSSNKDTDDFNQQSPQEKNNLHKTLSGIIEGESSRLGSNNHRPPKAFDKFKKKD